MVFVSGGRVCAHVDGAGALWLVGKSNSGRQLLRCSTFGEQMGSGVLPYHVMKPYHVSIVGWGRCCLDRVWWELYNKAVAQRD
jgi:hypothetical protein